jgi:isopenicillin-N epimerase
MSDWASPWEELCERVRAKVDGEFDLDPKLVHLNVMLMASPPRTVRDAITGHQTRFNQDPTGHFFSREGGKGPVLAIRETERAARAAALYLGLPANDARLGTNYIAQTDSTTMGLALLANGLMARKYQDVVTSVHDYPVMRDTWKRRCARSDMEYREIRLYEDPRAPDLQNEILDNVERSVRDSTRVLSLTWVHSSTGVKLPIREISALVRRRNIGRKPRERLLFCVDGVHGLGVERTPFEELGCDFLVSGCHKWLFGPRGTGIICAQPLTWEQLSPTIPTALPVATPGAKQTPGGVQGYEYQWAVAEAFDFHLAIGKADVEQYTHGIAERLKRGLAELAHVDVVTPMDEECSAGVVCCDIHGVPPGDAVALLRDRDIVAGTSLSDADGKNHLRFSPCILNTEEDIEKVVSTVAGMATG